MWVSVARWTGEEMAWAWMSARTSGNGGVIPTVAHQGGERGEVVAGHGVEQGVDAVGMPGPHGGHDASGPAV